MVDILSWYTVLCSMVYPCPSIKCFFQITCPRASSAQTNSLSVEIFTFNFCLLGMLVTAPSPRVIIAPVCPLHLSCVLYDGYTHHFTIDSESTIMKSFVCFITFRYFKHLFNLIQLSSSGFFTLVVKNVTVVCIYLLHLGLIYTSCSVMGWKVTAYYPGIYTDSDVSLIFNKWSPTGYVAVAPIYWGNDSKSFQVMESCQSSLFLSQEIKNYSKIIMYLSSEHHKIVSINTRQVPHKQRKL